VTILEPAMIVVVGGTGRVGRELAARLSGQGAPVRTVSRGLLPSRRPGVDAVQADLSDPATLEPHLAGADSMFVLWPFTLPEVTARLAPVVAGIAARHVSRVVYLSAQPAGGAARRLGRGQCRGVQLTDAPPATGMTAETEQEK
jgi:uncharacterized protein YbjT (DUF2867 family)